MATKSLLESALGKSVMNSVKRNMYDNFCSSLVEALASSASAGTVGRITYAALVGVWRNDTANGGWQLNEARARRIWDDEQLDPRVKRVGVEGHWSWYFSPSGSEAEMSDSLVVLVGNWLKSWDSWYESVVQYGHYGTKGRPAGSSISANLIQRVHSLWSTRGTGGRVAASSSEKAARKANKQLESMTATDKLALAAAALGISVEALAALQAAAAAK